MGSIHDKKRYKQSRETATLSEILELASYDSLVQHDMCPIFSLSKNHSSLVFSQLIELMGETGGTLWAEG